MKRAASAVVSTLCALGLAASSAMAEMAAPQNLGVQKFASAPQVDGDLSEWGDGWSVVPIQDAIEGDNKNRTGAIDVQVQFAVVGADIYFAARWPDASENRDYKPWAWKKSKKRYKRGKQRDDMFALRFDMAGDFRSCMIAKANYDVDVWLWSAGRSDQKGYASDMWHRISFDEIAKAAEYEMDDGTVIYIKKSADAGRPGFKNSKPKRKKFQGELVPGVTVGKDPRGSVADVSAKGLWKDGFWYLEMKRKLHTGNDDDVSLENIDSIRSQVAVFNQGSAEHKSVSGELILDLSAFK